MVTFSSTLQSAEINKPEDPFFQSSIEDEPQLEAKLRDGFTPFWEEFTNRVTFASFDIEETEKEAAYQKEKEFLYKVVTGVLTMADRHPDGPITLLFDVDDTLGPIKEDDEQGIRVLVRPAFALALEEIGQMPGVGNRLEIGLLTTKPQKALSEEANKPTFLAPLAGKVRLSPLHFISSRTAEQQNPWLDNLRAAVADNQVTDEELLPLVGDIVHPETLPEGRSLVSLFHSKLVILNQLVQDVPQDNPVPQLPVITSVRNDPSEASRAFVFIEDMHCADAIDPNLSRLIGVCVADEKQDVLMRALMPNSGITVMSAPEEVTV